MNNPHMKTSLFTRIKMSDRPAFGVIEDSSKLIASGKHPIWMQTIIARANLLREVGGLDEYLRYSEDHDVLFRMALKTRFCYISMPMVLIDRSPAEDRHFGEARNWHKEEFCLRMDQYRFEKQLALSEGLPSDTRKLVLQNLRNIHRAWASWYAERAEYKKALSSLSDSSRYGVTPALAVKWAFMRMAPELTRKLLLRAREKSIRYDRVSWKGEQAPVPLEATPEGIAEALLKN
jgi:hypothetical protein